MAALATLPVASGSHDSAGAWFDLVSVPLWPNLAAREKSRPSGPPAAAATAPMVRACEPMKASICASDMSTTSLSVLRVPNWMPKPSDQVAIDTGADQPPLSSRRTIMPEP